MKKIIYTLTGGRPMKEVQHTFTDVVSGERVSYYRDKFDRVFLATSPWAWFRVLVTHEREFEQ